MNLSRGRVRHSPSRSLVSNGNWKERGEWPVLLKCLLVQIVRVERVNCWRVGDGMLVCVGRSAGAGPHEGVTGERCELFQSGDEVLAIVGCHARIVSFALV